MAEEVGNLKVKLGMDDAEFTKSISSLSRNMRAIGNELKGLKNKGDEWGNSLTGLKAKQDTLNRALTTQKQQVQALESAYSKSVTEKGKDAKATEELYIKLKRAEAEYNKFETELNQVTSALSKQQAEVSKSQMKWQQLSEKMATVGAKMKSVGSSVKSAGQTMSAAVTLPIAALGTGAVKAAIDFESAFTGVKKTVDGSAKDFANLEKGIRNMSKEIPASASEIAAVAESAGQLGIAKENIISFSRTIIDLGNSTNLTAEQAATEFARFANITGMSQKDFDRLGSSIVALGNNFATTESEISSMAMRLAGQGKQVHMNESQIMALAAAMSSLGIEAEAGGTAMSTILNKMQTAVSNGGTKLEAFGKAAGMSGSEFKKAFETDAAGALDALIKGLGNSSKHGANLNEILGTLGIKGVRESDTLKRLAGSGDLLSRALKTSGDGWKENTALANEAEQRYKTTESQLKVFKNTVVDLGITLGSALIPMLLKLVNSIKPLVEKFAGLSSGTQMFIMAMAGIAAAIGPALIFIGMLISSIGSIAGVFAPVAVAIAEAGGAMAVFSSAIAVITGPIGIAVASIALFVGAITALWKNHEGFRNAVTTAWSAIQTAISSAISGIVIFVQSMGAQLSAFWSSNQGNLATIASTVWKGISAAITGAITVISSIMKVVWPVIQALVVSTWNAIKNVIQGVTKVITGIIQTFSALLTGDWKKAWEGIKQVLTGALQAIWGAINLYFVGKLLGPLKSFGPAAKGLVQGAWNGIKAITTSLLSGIKNVVVNSFNLIKSSISSVMSATNKVVTGGWTGIKSVTSTLVNGIKSVVVNIFSSLKGAVSTAMSAVKSAIVTGWNSAVSFLRGINLVTIGKNIIQGLINGIGSMMGAVTAKVKAMADSVTGTIKKALDIHSPSRKTKRLGEHTGQGFANGISSKQKETEKAASKLAASAKKEFNTKMSNLSLKFKADKIDITEYVKSLEAMKIKYADVPNAVAKINAQIVTLNKKHAKEVFDVAKNSIDEKVKMNELSLTQELAAWEKLQKNYKKGSDERKQIDENIYETKKKIHDQLTSLNDAYTTKIADANKRLAESEKALTDEYKKAVDDRTSSLVSFAGIFDEVSQTSDITGQKLIENLQGQVDVFESWSKNIQILAEKGIDKGLLEELRQMGPKAAPEIAALTTLTDTELTQYANLWKEKNVLARNQAVSELSQMKKDTNAKIKELRTETKKELDEYKKEWATKIKEIRTGTTDEFVTMKTSMKSIGKDTIKGLISGMEDMEDSLQNKAKSIADSISKTIKKALDIHSPSRVMRNEVGHMIPEGIAVGIDENTSAEEQAKRKSEKIIKSFNTNLPSFNTLQESSARLKNAVGNLYGSLANSAHVMSAGVNNHNVTHASYDQSRSYQPSVTIINQNPSTSPSQLARKAVQEQRRMAMEWGV